MITFSDKSFWTLDTDFSSKVYAIAGSDPSYKYYNNITWSMWGMWAPGNNKDFLSMYEDTSSANRSWLFSSQTDGTFRIIGSWDGASICLLKSANPVLDMSWHNFVVTFSNGTFNLYVDGVLQSLNEILPWNNPATSLNPANLPILIANKDPLSGPNNDDSAGGCYSNFSMWNKVLSQDEITALFNNGQPGDLTSHPALANLTNWWRMDQTDTPPALKDSVAPGASATIHTVSSGGPAVFQQTSNVPEGTPIAAPAGIAFQIPFTVRRSNGSGSYGTNGQYSAPSTRTLNLAGSIQPMGDREAQQMPEGEWEKEFIKIYSDVQLFGVEETNLTQADVVQYQGKNYKILRVRDYSTSIIPHYRSVAAFIGTAGV